MENFSDRFHIVLVEPEIAPNTGAVGRTCVGVGAMLWLVRPLGFTIEDRHLRRAGMDYWKYLDWRAVDSLDEVVEALKPGRLWYFSTKAEQSYTQIAYRPGDALVYGAESRGLPLRLLEENREHTVKIPIRPEARSLNLSISVAIGLYEAVRQNS